MEKDDLRIPLEEEGYNMLCENFGCCRLSPKVV
jgi:hypothetical protein